MNIVDTISLYCPKGFYCMRNANNKCPRLAFNNKRPYCEIYRPWLETDSSGNVLKTEKCLSAERKARLKE